MLRRATKTRLVHQECLGKDFATVVKEALSDYKQRVTRRLLGIGHYDKHLRTWWQHFKPGQLLEDFIADPCATPDRVLRFVNLPAFHYKLLAHKNSRGFWVLKGQPSKANRPPYEPMPVEAKQLLDAHYAP